MVNHSGTQTSFALNMDQCCVFLWLVQDKNTLFQQFDEDANGTLDQREIGKVNATIFNIFPRLGYMGSEPPGEMAHPLHL